MEKGLLQIIENLLTRGKISDIHFSPNRPIYYRLESGKLQKCDEIILSDDELRNLLIEANLLDDFDDYKNKDTNFTSSNFNFSARVNIFQESQGTAASFRIIYREIPDLKNLFIPNTIRDFIYKEHGLLVIAGPTGAGKSTTIASLIQVIHQDTSQCKHIITLEDPIEYYYGDGYSLISQRMIGVHCNSFADGLREALREDPDIIVVGEMRDADTIKTALTAAETGHLVLTTLHSANTIEAVDRFLQYVQSADIEPVRAQLANCFEAIVAQKLIPSKKDSKKRVPAFEILTRNMATTNLIRNGRHHNITSYLNKQDGMISFKDYMETLSLRGLI